MYFNKSYLKLFITSFLLSVAWENAHSVLYVSYKGGVITEPILLRASFIDACIIVVVFFLSLQVAKRYHALFFYGALVVVAVLIEWWALDTNRWAYTALMPILPILGVGLSPTFQLAISAYIARLFVIYIERSRSIDK